MFVLRSTLDATVAVYNGENLRLSQQLADERERVRALTTQLSKAIEATEAERATLAEVARNLHVTLGQAVEAAREVLGREMQQLRLELASERGRREVLAAQLATALHNADWLRGLINTTNTERATLLAHRGIAVPAPQIAGLPGMAPAPDDRDGMASGASGIGAGVPGTVQDLLDAFAGSMEDMGDTAAERAGLTHDEQGAVIFGREG